MRHLIAEPPDPGVLYEHLDHALFGKFASVASYDGQQYFPFFDGIGVVSL
jgi:hypothetical protein